MQLSSVKLNIHYIINSLQHTNSFYPRRPISTQSATVCSVTGPNMTFYQLPNTWIFKYFYLFILIIYSFIGLFIPV